MVYQDAASVVTVASAAAATFPATTVQTPYGAYPLPVVMAAIAMAEDGGGTGPGDPLSIYQDGGAAEQAWSCGGYTSFGAWQVNLPANHALVASLSGIGDPCGMATWLQDYGNCAQAALAIYRSQGLGAWTTYQEGTYSGWLPAAAQALGVGGGATLPIVSAPVAIGLGGIALGVLLLAGGYVGERTAR